MNNIKAAVEVRASIRCNTNISWQALVQIFKNKSKKIIIENQRYLYGFFEEVYPSLMLKFIHETGLTKEDIIAVFKILPDRGEKHKFDEVLLNGQF